MWSLFPVKILQDANSSFSISLLQDKNFCQYFYWIASPVAVIIASGVAVWFTFHKDRFEAKKKMKFFVANLVTVRAKIVAFNQLIAEDINNIERCTYLIISCYPGVKILERNIVDSRIKGPSINEIADLYVFTHHFEGLFEKVKKPFKELSIDNITAIRDKAKLVETYSKEYEESFFYKNKFGKRYFMIKELEEKKMRKDKDKKSNTIQE